LTVRARTCDSNQSARVITIEAIKSYARFGGDRDALSRGGTAAGQATDAEGA
jgi:hypothetical protein